MNQILILLCLAVFASAVVIPHELDVVMPSQTCFQCLCLRESGCKPIGCNTNNGIVGCGYYQLSMDHYLNCGRLGYQGGEDMPTAFRRCAANYACSTQCVKNYYQSNAGNCAQTQQSPCQQMVRIHDGGPTGCTNDNTLSIWNDVQKCCTGQC